jgi:uncharacterized protein (DUF1778 family)
MSTRIHMVLGEEEKALLERAARREGLTLSSWLREAAREKLERAEPPILSTVEDLTAFFQECDEREEGREPDWEAHRRVIEGSRREGLPEP